MERNHPLSKYYSSIDSGEPVEKMNNIVEFPKIIELEITNHCNYKCIMCPTGIGTVKRPRGNMQEEMFNKLVEEILCMGGRRL